MDRAPRRLPVLCRHLEDPAFPGTLGSVQTLHPHTALPPSYADGPVQAHLQTGALAGIKSIYTCVLMIYHTTLVKAVSEARKPLPLFESVPTDVSVREQVQKNHLDTTSGFCQIEKLLVITK